MEIWATRSEIWRKRTPIFAFEGCSKVQNFWMRWRYQERDENRRGQLTTCRNFDKFLFSCILPWNFGDLDKFLNPHKKLKFSKTASSNPVKSRPYKNREISTFLGTALGGIIRGPMSAQPEISTFKGSIKNPAKCPRDARGQKNTDS